MGIDRPSIVLLTIGKHLGVDFGATGMVGRQNFVGDVSVSLERMFKELKITADPHQLCSQNFYCEKLFDLLGAREVHSFDVSNYQQATHIHDMNLPVPAEFHQRYSCVYDGGTIEHVFNIPQALKNCLEMVQLGGHFMQVNIANNYMGHGFWQFSPEMIFRAISAENGFEIRTVLLHEVIPGGAWHIVVDPEKVGRRVELCNASPTYILTIAKRTAIKDVFAKPPQQSDYVAAWNATPNTVTHPVPQTQAPQRSLLQRAWGRFERLVTGKPVQPVYDPGNYHWIDEELVWQGRL